MYQIVLEGKQIKRNQVTGMHLMAGFLLITMGLFTWLVPNSVKQKEFDFLNYAGLVIAFLGLIIVFVCIFFNKKIIQTKANLSLRLLELSSLTLILLYSLYQKWYLPAGYSAVALLGIILAFYWEKTGKKNKVATFTDEGAHVPGLGKDTDLPWQAIRQILLRHNILTVDCRDNKLYQLLLAEGQSIINKEEFETYCRFQIEAKKHLLKTEW
jgi:hypothetical protein